MWLFFLVAIPAVSTAVTWLSVRMPAPHTAWHVKVDCAAAWFVALSSIILVPLDISNAYTKRTSPQLSTWWMAVYWYSFICQVLVLPLHSEYASSCEFTIMDRLLYSLKNNFAFYGVVGLLGLLGVTALLATHRFTVDGILGYCIALSNAYGLLAAIFLLGFGLVDIPRALWTEGDAQQWQEALQGRAGQQASKVGKAYREVCGVAEEAHRVNGMFGRRDPLRKYMDEIMETLDQAGVSAASPPERSSGRSTRVEDEDYFDRHDLARLRRRVHQGVEDYDRTVLMYRAIIRKYIKAHDIATNLHNDERQYYSSLPEGNTAPWGGQAPVWLRSIIWWWRCRLRKVTFRLLSLLCWAMCAVVVAAEVSIQPVLHTLPNLSAVSALLQRVKGSPLLLQLASFAVLGYLCGAAYYALFRAARFSWYTLVPGHSPAYSLCSNAMFMTRFAPPLAFHFMYAIAMPPKEQGVPDFEDTVFFKTIGHRIMHAPLFGTDFSTLVPIAIVPYILLIITGAFDRLMRAIMPRGSQVTFEDEYAMADFKASGLRLLSLEYEQYRLGSPLGSTVDLITGARRVSGPPVQVTPSQPAAATGYRTAVSGRQQRSWAEWWASSGTETPLSRPLLDDGVRHATWRSPAGTPPLSSARPATAAASVSTPATPSSSLTRHVTSLLLGQKDRGSAAGRGVMQSINVESDDEEVHQGGKLWGNFRGLADRVWRR